MFAACFGAAGVTAAQETPEPAVTSWTDEGTGYPRTAQLSISYPHESGYSDCYSLTALYNSSNGLVGVGYGRIGADGGADYAVDITDEGASTVKCFVWDDLSTLHPTTSVYETTYGEFINAQVEDFVVTKGLGIRNSFESGIFQIFQNNGNYNVELAADVTAHSGENCAKVSNRSATENNTMRTKILASDLTGGSILTASAYMRKPDDVAEAEFYITVIPIKTKLSQTSETISVTDNNWHKVEYSLNLSDIDITDGCIVQLGARSGDEYIDYYADDFKVLCPDATTHSVYDDVKSGGLKWDFESGETNDYVTETRKMWLVGDAHKWTRTLNAQELTVVNTADAEFWNTTTTNTNVPNELQEGARTTPPEGSTKMLQVKATQADFTNSHVSARIKLSKLDLIPGHTYQLSFWAFGNTKSRGLYAGLIKHSESEDNPKEFYGGSSQKTPSGATVNANQLAGGIITYSDEEAEYKKNYVAQIQRFWKQYTVTLTPTAANFNSDGYCELCFVMTEDRPTQNDWYFKSIYLGEKLYLDEIEITDVTPAPGELTALVNDGLYTKRATFENDNMDMFSPQTRSSVVLTDAEANTGSYSAEFENRQDNWTSLGASLKGADLTSNVTASCYVKKNSLQA